MDTREFYDLSPSEIAILCLASDLNPKPNDGPIILPSGATYVLMTILSEGVAAREENIDLTKVLHIIEYFSSEAATYLSARDFYVRYDYTVRNLLKHLDQIEFPILPYYPTKMVDEKAISKVSESYDYGLTKYQSAFDSLEAKGLVIDPPWFKHPALIGGLIVLLGCFPLEINYRTKKGSELIHRIKIEAKFWEYEKTQEGEEEKVHINIKIAKFIDDAIGRFGNSFVESWKTCNPERIKELSEDHNNK